MQLFSSEAHKCSNFSRNFSHPSWASWDITRCGSLPRVRNPSWSSPKQAAFQGSFGEQAFCHEGLPIGLWQEPGANYGPRDAHTEGWIQETCWGSIHGSSLLCQGRPQGAGKQLEVRVEQRLVSPGVKCVIKISLSFRRRGSRSWIPVP